MKDGFASTAMRADRERVALWRSLGGFLLHQNGAYRIGRDPVPGDPRMPSPARVPEAIAQEAAAAGMPVRRADDLFARAA